MSHTTALRINTRKCTARSVYRMMYSTVHCKLYMNDLCLNNGKFQDSLWVNGRCINERVLITVRYPPIFCKHSLFVSFASLLVQYTGILFPYVLCMCVHWYIVSLCMCVHCCYIVSFCMCVHWYIVSLCTCVHCYIVSLCMCVLLYARYLSFLVQKLCDQ